MFEDNDTLNDVVDTLERLLPSYSDTSKAHDALTVAVDTIIAVMGIQTEAARV